MADVIVVFILIAAVGGSCFCMYKKRKSGAKCLGCSSCNSCSGTCDSSKCN